MKINKTDNSLVNYDVNSNSHIELASSQQETTNSLVNQKQTIIPNNKIEFKSQLKNDFDGQRVQNKILTGLSDNTRNNLEKSNLVNKSTARDTSHSSEFKTQAGIKNLLHVASRLQANVTKYSNQIETNSKSLTSSVSKILNDIKSCSTLLQKAIESSANGLEERTLNQFNDLNNHVEKTISSVSSNTNDFLYNTQKNLQNFNNASTSFLKASQDLKDGNAFATYGVMDSFEKIKSIPPQIAKDHTEYKNLLKQDVSSLSSKSNALAESLTSSASHKTNAKDLALNLAKSSSSILDSTYTFNYPNEYTEPLVKAYYQSLQNLTMSVLFPDFNPKGKPISESLLKYSTNDLRETTKLASQGNSDARAKLQKDYGYTLDNVPKPGQMWLAANYVAGDLDRNGQVTAKTFPGTSSSKPIDTNPPDVKNLLFGKDSKGKVELTNSDGKQVTVSSLGDYQKVVAENRAKAGIAAGNGEPMPVHVSFEGGGGFGKRHAAAVSEMYNLGLVPASVSGVSAGSINAGLIAAGLSPSQADEVSKDPAIKKFIEVNPLGGPGLTTGREFYRYMDQKLREITGIKDRPVTFSDLKMPLYIGATKIADSQAPNDMTRTEDRIFVFSKETTPDTPVAMAMTASAAVPGSFDPVEFVDVATGRTIRLVDGGMINNLPIGYQKNNLPEIALKLERPDTNNPKTDINNAKEKPLPSGDLISYTPFGNTQIGINLFNNSAEEARNFKVRNNPPPGVFVLNLPTWNLKNYVNQDNVVDYQYDNKIDPDLDRQTAQLTDDFVRQYFTQLNDPTKSGTNLKPAPKDSSFSRTLTLNGVNWTVEHQANSDKVTFRSDSGEVHNLNLGKDRIENWLADDASFGDLSYRLRDVLVDFQKYSHPFGV